MANELELKYGCNPNQKPARIFMKEGELPIEVLNGRPGYINLLDAFNSWQLVKELKEATGLPAAASFKHVSPAGAAVAVEMSDTLKKIYFVDDVKLSPLATAYARARGADRMSSYGDFIALSDTCDEETARIINREVSDGVIAPDYTPEALEILKNKRKGTYNVIKIDPAYRPAPIEHKDVFGVTFEQGRNELKIDESLLKEMPTQNKEIPADAKRDLIIALITLKYTQSNSVCYAKDGQAIGIGAGQQSRIHCTRLAGNKADIWYLRQHPKVMNLPWIEKIRREVLPENISYQVRTFQDDLYEIQAMEYMLKDTILFFAIVSIIITLLGVYSSITLDTERRQKEVAIRKVNGAGMSHIIWLFARLYITLLMVTAALSFPLVYLVLQLWKQIYTVFFNCGFWFWTGIFISVAMITALTIWFRILKIARVNPVESIKNE